ncbi:MAG: glycosyltransferase [Spirochaetes bacterium]|nr:glycosyltransferase [Spirochaetota bacterium]
MVQTERPPEKDTGIKEISGVSLVYLSYNGADFLLKKINFLLQELSVFDKYELIIMDDHSTDKSQEIINSFRDYKHIKIIFKSEQRGIPHSMNTGVKASKFEHIVFCDQRQNLSDNIISQLVSPLKNKKVGAVSGCISHFDKENRFSFIRAYENFIKIQEGKTGNLIGVYGPLYAIKKECYTEIPDPIILDDLYLTLKILGSKQVLFLRECQIFDEYSSLIYNYQRTKRYLKGFLQLINEKGLICHLKKKQIIMLFWHKYFRLFIPLLLFLCYVSFGIKSIGSPENTIVFLIITLIVLISILLSAVITRGTLMKFIRINFLYFIAWIELFFVGFFNKVKIH